MAEKKGFKVKILKDFGAFGFGSKGWTKRLTKTSWEDKEPVFDIRHWNEDLTRSGKGITLESGEMFELLGLIEDALEAKNES